MSRIGGLVAGKLAFVTGAGSGIGRSTCQVLSREGATVIAADKNVKAAEETIKSLPPSAGDSDHSFLLLDVDLSHSVNNALEETMRQYKKCPSIVINSAGITRDNWMVKLSEMDFDSVMDVNLKGTFLVMQAFSRAMIDSKVPEGSIVNISSIVGTKGNLGQANYAASKAGVIGMTKAASMEMGQFNIRINSILPGFIETPMVQTVPDKVRDLISKQISLKRLGKPEEIAEVIAFLSSDKSSYITGAAIEITGGYY